MVLDCPQPAGWSTGVDAKTADVSEAGHEATGSGEGISLGLPTWVFKVIRIGFAFCDGALWTAPTEAEAVATALERGNP